MWLKIKKTQNFQRCDVIGSLSRNNQFTKLKQIMNEWIVLRENRNEGERFYLRGWKWRRRWCFSLCVSLLSLGWLRLNVWSPSMPMVSLYLCLHHSLRCNASLKASLECTWNAYFTTNVLPFLRLEISSITTPLFSFAIS